jgi:hypothetical protein
MKLRDVLFIFGLILVCAGGAILARSAAPGVILGVVCIAVGFVVMTLDCNRLPERMCEIEKRVEQLENQLSKKV